MKKQRHIRSSERCTVGAGASLFRTGWPLLALLFLPPVFGYFRHSLAFGTWGRGLIVLVIAGGFAFIFWEGLLTRTTQSNTQIYSRSAQPVRYWLTLFAWLMGYAFGTSFYFWAQLPS